MQWQKTVQEAIDFIFNSIKNIDPNNTNITHEDVKSVFEDIFDEKIEQATTLYLNDIDKNIMAENSNDEKFIDDYLAQRIPKYYEIIADTVTEIIEEYTKDEKITSI